MIRPCNNADFDAIYEIINDAAQAYCGIIPHLRVGLNRWRGRGWGSRALG
jgi:hypothetical protein